MNIDDLVRTRSIRDVVGSDGRRNWFVCPLPGHVHHNNTPSFSIYRGENGYDRFMCHGNCGASGDVVDLVGFMSIPGYDSKRRDHVLRAAELLQGGYEAKIIDPVTEYDKIDPGLWREYLPADEPTIQYATSRGIINHEKFKIGTMLNFMTMPYFEDGELIGVKMRNILKEFPEEWKDWRKIRFMSAKGSKAGIFNIDAVAYSLEPLLIVKAEIPAVMLSEYGFLACAPTWGENDTVEHSRIGYWKTKFAVSRNVIVVGDNDVPGRRAAKVRADALHATAKFPPEQYKDIDEWVLADSKALLEIERWLYGR